jgi:hypothetical protein
MLVSSHLVSRTIGFVRWLQQIPLVFITIQLASNPITKVKDWLILSCVVLTAFFLDLRKCGNREVIGYGILLGNLYKAT